jgi:hypothetical protein
MIERLVNSGNWETITSVSAKGNSTSLINYSTIDAHPGKGNNLYRLKMIDQNGQFDYSVVRRVNFNESISYMVYPNPASNVLNIVTDNTNGSASIQLLTVQGQLLLNKQSSGNGQVVQLNVSTLPSGMYLLKIVAVDGSVHMEKFAKQ